MIHTLKFLKQIRILRPLCRSNEHIWNPTTVPLKRGSIPYPWFWDGSGSLDPYTELRILLFSSVAFKMPKNMCFFRFLLIIYGVQLVHLHQSTEITSQLEVTKQLKSRLSIFLLVDERIRIRIRILEARTLTDPASDPEHWIPVYVQILSFSAGKINDYWSLGTGSIFST